MVIDIPDYVKDPKYNFGYLLVVQKDNNLYQYRKAFYNKWLADKDYRHLNDIYPILNFKVISLNSIH